MLLIIQVLIFLATFTGLFYLLRHFSKALFITKMLSLGYLLLQLGWLIWLGFSFHRCVLLDPWGVMGVFTIAVLLMAFWASNRYQTPRIFLGALVLLSIVIILGRIFFPAPMQFEMRIGWKVAFHILFTSAGLAILAVGCVVGIMILVRTRILKSINWAFTPEIPWPSLTDLDKLFFNTLGVGITALSIGIAIGIWMAPRVSLRGVWYEDPKVVLSSLGWGVYGWVWISRRRQGFYSWMIVAIATLGYILILLGFFLSNFLANGFHRF